MKWQLIFHICERAKHRLCVVPVGMSPLPLGFEPGAKREFLGRDL